MVLRDVVAAAVVGAAEAIGSAVSVIVVAGSVSAVALVAIPCLVRGVGMSPSDVGRGDRAGLLVRGRALDGELRWRLGRCGVERGGDEKKRQRIQRAWNGHRGLSRLRRGERNSEREKRQ